MAFALLKGRINCESKTLGFFMLCEKENVHTFRPGYIAEVLHRCNIVVQQGNTGRMVKKEIWKMPAIGMTLLITELYVQNSIRLLSCKNKLAGLKTLTSHE